MTINLALVITITLFLIPLLKKLDEIINICISGILYTIGFGILSIFHTHNIFIISTVIWTAGQIINFVFSYVYTANHSPVTHRGRFSALIPFISQGGFALAPMLTGLFIK